MTITKTRDVGKRIADIGVELEGAAVARGAVAGTSLRDVSTTTDSAQKRETGDQLNCVCCGSFFEKIDEREAFRIRAEPR
jgi:hypothetical protein